MSRRRVILSEALNSHSVAFIEGKCESCFLAMSLHQFVLMQFSLIKMHYSEDTSYFKLVTDIPTHTHILFLLAFVLPKYKINKSQPVFLGAPLGKISSM